MVADVHVDIVIANVVDDVEGKIAGQMLGTTTGAPCPFHESATSHMPSPSLSATPLPTQASTEKRPLHACIDSGRP